MLDWNKIKRKATQYFEEGKRKVRQYTPESWSPEKKFVNALVISMALMTIADKKVETSEVIKSIEIIKEIEEIEELNLVQEAIELYEKHLEDLEKALDKGEVKYIIEVERKLADIAKIKEYPEYSQLVINLLNIIANADGDFAPEEKEMKLKIMETLDKA